MSSQRHLNMHRHNTKGGLLEYECNQKLCGKRFQASRDLEYHIRLHDNRLDSCFFCPWKGISGKNHSETHLSHHFNILGPLKCHFCEKRFFNPARRTEHEELHEKIEDRYKCKFCKFMTHSKTAYGKHKAICGVKS